MGITYTKEQQEVIDTHGCNILVSAAAGSGKTAVLVERIVKMVSDEAKPIDIDRLLVVTFTNAAAAEMRERIGNAIAARLEEEPWNEHLQKQAALVHNAQITTIDSFCMFVIRNNFNDIGLDPGFRVADEGELKLLKKDVMAELLEQKFEEGNASFLHCVEYFSTGNHDRAVEEHILKLYQFAESYPWPEEWLLDRKHDYEIDSLEALEERNDGSWITFCMEQIRSLTQDCVRKMEECILICEQPDGPYMYAEVLEREKQRLERLTLLTRYSEGYSFFGGMTFDRLPSRKDDSVSGTKREIVQGIRKEIKEICKDLCAKYFPAQPETVLKYMKGSSAAVAELVDLTLEYKEALDKKKRESNIIDFSDMEHLALSILIKRRNNESSYCMENGDEPSRYPKDIEITKTALDYRAFFTEILIDEYQDSNLVQEYLLESVSGESEGAFNRFMVGDVKQSIYKFRLARPEIFMKKYNDYKAGSDTERRIDLHKNFRSRKEILDSVNYIFSQIMGRKLGGVEYDDKAALYPGAVYPAVEQDEEGISQNCTELLLIKKQESEEGKMTVRQREAYAVAKRIKELVGHFPVTDKESGALRPARYQDIVILLRTNAGWDEDFKSVLKEEGIPSHVASKTGYFAAKEIQTLLQLLRILDNPQQDIPLFGVLKSYFGNFDEEEIAKIRAVFSDKKKKLYLCLKEFEADDAALGEKVRNFLEFLEEYRDKTVYMPIHELMRDIAIETGYLHYVTALPGGEQRKANVETLLERASAFERTSYYGLFHFIRYMEQLEKYDVDYGEANILDENADVVRIMSIHKSKGLEFPICFVSGLAKWFNMMDTNGKMIADMDMGIGADYVDVENRLQSKTLRKNVIAEKMRLDNLGEELRVLYVALTRAKEKLIMTGAVDKLENKLNALVPMRLSKEPQLFYSELTGAGSYLDFILPALVRHSSFASIWKEFGYEDVTNSSDISYVISKAGLYAGDAQIRVRLIGDEELAGAEIKEQIQAEGARRRLHLSDRQLPVDERLMTHMSEIFDYTYEHENLKDLYTKTTVSELKKAGQEEETDFSFHLYEEEIVIPYIPRFMQEEEVLGGAGRGSAFHKVMELMDFTDIEARVPVGEQIAKMQKQGLLSTEYAGVVSVTAIEEFMNTGLAARMAEAEKHGCLHREQPFVLGLPANELNEKFPSEELVLIQGIIDVYFEEDAELVVADYKTDKVNAPEELVKRYEKQLDYYAKALEQLTGKRVKEKIIYSFGLRKEIMI
ncbi:DNA helicase/exodeoxyribonuclease V subunit A [Kineothrix alysoides]|uniref:ATP-dependent helicase/nuclease subunit A n=1 Tax=Kineothrix alysoides TaxID=1469948 RepID=A0A4R1R4H1_9FIRM|nr:helicase-exonuclease AddAB subunit AddA [Kineothrix alysoides]TCL60396.1 DNA helicase/exodeoxyribonuclease V subunit A [Kineothrix alysoides]